MSTETVVELFAGPGGTSTGLRWAGWAGRSVGYDHDAAACRTGRAAGHERVQADVAALDPRKLHACDDVVGLIGTPPCPSFSTAGKGAGRKLLAILATAITHAARGEFDRDEVVRRCARLLFLSATDEEQGVVGRRRPLSERIADARAAATMSALVVEPMRWVHELGPQWVMLEQVPAVLPLWTHMAAVLRGHGYSATAAIVSAEEYGVPQTRKRAILVASRVGRARIPETTHQPYRAGRAVQTEPDLFGEPLPPPVSMATALGWDTATVVRSNYSTGGNADERGERTADQPAATVTGKVDRNVVLRAGDRGRSTARGTDEPAPTVLCSRTTNPTWLTTGNNSHVTGRTGSRRGEGDVQAYGRSTDAPAPTLDTNVGGKWRLRNNTQDNAATRGLDEPAGTIFYGKRANAVDWTSDTGDSTRVSVTEAGVLQSFPPDYPWQGTKTQQYRCVGDSVPPLLAMHCLRQFVAAATRSDVA